MVLEVTSFSVAVAVDRGYELLGCWIATMKNLGGGVSSSCASANCISALTSAPDRTACARKLRSHAYKLPSSLHLTLLCPEDD